MLQLNLAGLGPVTVIKSDANLIPDHASLQGKRVVDVGCGTGDMVVWFTQQGADAMGVDVDTMVPKARAAHPEIANSFLVGTGERLPLADASADLVLFLASFHHVPEALMPEALAEAHRALDTDGRLILVEPVAADGAYSTLTRLVEDETHILEAAKKAINRLTEKDFTRESESLIAFERKLSDFRNLLQAHVEDEDERRDCVDRAEQLTASLASFAGVASEEFTYLSICRRTVLSKAPAAPVHH